MVPEPSRQSGDGHRPYWWARQDKGLRPESPSWSFSGAPGQRVWEKTPGEAG